MRERDTAWLTLAAYGTSELHEWPRVVIHDETRQGRAFPLTEVTYFYGANTQWAQPHELRPGTKQCAWEVLFAIRKLVESYDVGVVG